MDAFIKPYPLFCIIVLLLCRISALKLQYATLPPCYLETHNERIGSCATTFLYQSFLPLKAATFLFYTSAMRAVLNHLQAVPAKPSHIRYKTAIHSTVYNVLCYLKQKYQVSGGWWLGLATTVWWPQLLNTGMGGEAVPHKQPLQGRGIRFKKKN